MQQVYYFRYILHAEKITGRPEGGTSLHVHPLNTPLQYIIQIIFIEFSGAPATWRPEAAALPCVT